MWGNQEQYTNISVMRKQESAVTVPQDSSEVLSASGYRQVNKTYGWRHNEEKGTHGRCFDIMG